LIEQFVVRIPQVDATMVAVVGGKGAHLGELSRMDGIRVPAGFCITTAAFGRAVTENPSIGVRLDQLARLESEEKGAIREPSADIRQIIEDIAIPGDLVAAITDALSELGEDAAYAVRSSSTTEDSASASFAGQHDSYLNVVGTAEILTQVSRCWASLFTDRAVAYRRANDIDHHAVRMAVVVQRMAIADAAGILFTADPVTSNRKVVTVEASFGLGEALVSGRVTPDVYTVRDGELVRRAIAQRRPALTDAQVLDLAQFGRRIEAHFGRPQDIEWCMAAGDFQFLQSRPITTLFPVPASADGENHVYISVGHQQMMTDPMKPLGLAFWQLTTPAPMAEAGGRLFVDVTQRLATPASRDGLLEAIGRSDPLTEDAMRTILERDGFVRQLPDQVPPGPLFRTAPGTIDTDPVIVTELIARSEASIAAVEREIATKSGAALLDFIEADIQELRRILFDPESHRVFMSAMEASRWLNDHLHTWLGEKNAADILTQSVPHNVTSEMGLALLDVADAIRPHPEVVAFLHTVKDEGFLTELSTIPGGPQARTAVEGWLEKYGMRCVGEIDITRPRWREQPSMLVPVILGNVRNFEPGAGPRRFEQGRQEALAKEQDVLMRLRQLPDGEQKANESKQMIDRVRSFMGYREYPKYGMVSRYFVYKKALLREAERLVRADVLRDKEDIFFLRFAELRDVVRTNEADDLLIAGRKDDYRSYRALTTPRVITSDGEVINGAYRRNDVPNGALVGLPVSAGVVEGRARVIPDMARADLEPGDILVTAYTDPSWTPLFVAIKGLVTEVGGQMTHGAVIAREYGLPAVVGVVGATRCIPDGQRVRVNGTEGYVELLT
jgi:phosphoenolpyruvate synthase/pyruvate phosphate dikinase